MLSSAVTMKKKKLLSVLLTLVLVVTLMPAMTFTSQAKADYSVSTMAQLKSYMESEARTVRYCRKTSPAMRTAITNSGVRSRARSGST